MKAKNANGGTISAASVRLGDRKNVRIAKARQSATAPYPRGSVGADLAKRNYVKYLIERYHHYREADTHFGQKTPLYYAVLFKNIETKFKMPTYFIPAGRFEELVEYLYSRIDRTILGRRNITRGVRNFESFDEYLMEHMSAPKA